MAEEMGQKLSAADAVGEAARYATVGVVSGSGKEKWQGLGSGALIEWQERQFVLTAAHVIEATETGDLRFFMPTRKVPGNTDRATLLDLKGATDSQLHPFSELAVRKLVVDNRLDLAAIDITGAVGPGDVARFVRVDKGGSTPNAGVSVVSRGYPHDLTRRLIDQNRVAFMLSHWATVVEAPQDVPGEFDPALHFLTPFEGQAGTHPRGMSGAAGWTQRKRGDQLWYPDLDLAGVTITHLPKQNLLKLVRREVVESFLATA